MRERKIVGLVEQSKGGNSENDYIYFINTGS